MISKYISLEKFCTCSQTFQKYSNQIDPYPWNSESVDAIALLFQHLIDPIIDHFGRENFQLTYGFCSIDLKKFLEKGRNQTCCQVDQHCAHEVNRKGNYICDRLGASCDFLIKGVGSNALVRHISQTGFPFDSIYYYGDNRPIHISYGPQHKKQGWGFREDGTPYKLFRLKKPL